MNEGVSMSFSSFLLNFRIVKDFSTDISRQVITVKVFKFPDLQRGFILEQDFRVYFDRCLQDCSLLISNNKYFSVILCKEIAFFFECRSIQNGQRLVILGVEPWRLIKIFNARLTLEVKQVHKNFFSLYDVVAQVFRIISEKVKLVVYLKQKFDQRRVW